MEHQIIDLAPRQSGKTTRAIEWMLNAPDRGIVTFSHQERERILDVLRHHVWGMEYQARQRDILVWTDLIHPHERPRARELWIDNADYILSRFISLAWPEVVLAGFSMSNDVLETLREPKQTRR